MDWNREIEKLQNLKDEEDEEKYEEENEEEIKNDIIEKPFIKSEEEIVLNFIDLFFWFQKYGDEFEDINKLGVKVKGVDETNLLFFSTPLYFRGKKMENEKDIIVFRNVKNIFAINSVPLSLRIFPSSSMEIIYNNLSNFENTYFKLYITRRYIFLVMSEIIEMLTIPFFIKRIIIDNKKKITKKREEKEVERKPIIKNVIIKKPTMDKDMIKEILENVINIGLIEITYQFIRKVQEEMDFKTNREILLWFNKKEKETIDVKHLLKIDQTIYNYILLYNMEKINYGKR